ncbi:MAG: hypothetical protein OQK98_12200 [Gammaproteobacteria bacterium]|nr:hypothetical protein [Gammaproteobacteria bacterium]
MHTFINVIPVIIGMLLLTSLNISVFHEQITAGLFGNGELVDTPLGASIGSIAAANPLASYLLGGEMLGARFTIYRNIISFIASIAIAFLTIYTLQFFGLS